MANKLDSTGLTVGEFNGTVKTIVDNTSSGWLLLDQTQITIEYKVHTVNQGGNVTLTLPSCSVGHGSGYSVIFQLLKPNVTIKLPSGGTYAYNTDGRTINIATAPRASGGSTIATNVASGQVVTCFRLS